MENLRCTFDSQVGNAEWTAGYVSLVLRAEVGYGDVNLEALRLGLTFFPSVNLNSS